MIPCFLGFVIFIASAALLLVMTGGLETLPEAARIIS
jgi:hypothetical protein